MASQNRGDAEEGYHELSQDGYYELPPYPQTRRRSCCTFSWPVVVVLVVMVFLVGGMVTAGFVLWPTAPGVEVKMWKLNGISVDSKETESILPAYQLNVSLDMLVEIQNPNYAGLVYKDVTVRIVYRGDEVGQVQSEGERIKARSSANHTATVELEGNEIFDNAKELVADYYNGELPLTTYATFDGYLKFWVAEPLLKVTVACDLVLNPKNNTILSQECGF
ncbi:hypothetical protein KC19_5G093000 [Ceratodon purpureus]|uniref:Late embryogenesis abundant protein LEA-2 subgroup domain-containing protein n=1 Tax=Ceratodon purpureus TaxID=3225 RepID=A0A8T0I1Q5_CERPU|nr:hypothetical protein KC19_5G093000 [Ceratodon purpureus]